MTKVDVTILGGGPGGYLAAERLAHAGKKVVLVEADELGGTCLNVGCIPTKTLLNSAKLYSHALHSSAYGVNVEGASYDWAKMQSWKNEVVKGLVGGIGAMEKRLGVNVIKGYGVFKGPGRVEVNGELIESEHVIIATGSVPVIPPIPGLQDNPSVVDSTGLLSIPEVPGRLAVIGGGVIGVEFAQLFAALGSKVSVIEMMPEIAPMVDKDLAVMMRKSMPEITFSLGCKVTKVEGGTVHYLSAAGAEETVEADTILVAVGRKAAVEGWGAQESGLDLYRGGVVADERMRTNLPNVWAIGDVNGKSLLAHSAYRMAEVAVANILDPQAHRRGEILRTNMVPWVIYTQPEVAGVGLTEDQAREAGYEVVTATAPGYMSGRYVAETSFRAPGAAKIVVDAESQQVLGIQVIASYASEMIWGAVAVLELEMMLGDLRQLTIPHPTVSELIREAAWAVKI
ncbi:MAG: dihydrolipoyl dehydrogenase [Actinomycetaceae bacterium]|nr:dihydrolipoyl dehydrogenase [Actinomycetaceae bacterium]